MPKRIGVERDMITSQWKIFAYYLKRYPTADGTTSREIRRQLQFIAPPVREPQPRWFQGAEPYRVFQAEPARRSRAGVELGDLRRLPRHGQTENNSRVLESGGKPPRLGPFRLPP